MAQHDVGADRSDERQSGPVESTTRCSPTRTLVSPIDGFMTIGYPRVLKEIIEQEISAVRWIYLPSHAADFS